MTELLKQIFDNAHTKTEYSDRDVPEATIRAIYDKMKLAPTAFNTSPARFHFVRSAEAKKKLADCAMDGNKPRILTAPFTVIVAVDHGFAEHMPKLFPVMDIKSMMDGNPDMAKETAERNALLQGGYFILTARALGLDCSPMSGINREAIDKAFFQGTKLKSNFIVCLGYGKPDAHYPRNPRLTFEEACKIH